MEHIYARAYETERAIHEAEAPSQKKKYLAIGFGIGFLSTMTADMTLETPVRPIESNLEALAILVKEHPVSTATCASLIAGVPTRFLEAIYPGGAVVESHILGAHHAKLDHGVNIGGNLGLGIFTGSIAYYAIKELSRLF